MTANEAQQTMTPGELAEAREYGRLELACDLADKALDLTYLAAFTFLWAIAADAWLAGWIDRDWLRWAAMFLVVTLGHLLVSFPLSFYASHRLEHRFGMSKLTFAGWLWRYVKRNTLAIVFGLLLMVALFAVIRWTGPWWWLAAAAGSFLVSIVFAQLAPVLIMPLFYKIEKVDQPELAGRIERLAMGTGLAIEGVYRMDMSRETVKANAMLAGLGRTRRVILGDTLLDGFTPDEIEVIFAHEIGHHVHRHIPKLIAAGMVFMVAGFWACDFVLRAWMQHTSGVVDYAALPVSSLPLLMFSLTAFSLLLEPVQNVLSRRYERQCDRYALKRTGLQEAYLSAFRKLAVLNKDDPCPNPVAVFLFHSHPPIAERLAIADD
ncbi:MAG: M48 family metallopeptidase [Pirellulales bacterium]